MGQAQPEAAPMNFEAEKPFMVNTSIKCDRCKIRTAVQPGSCWHCAQSGSGLQPFSFDFNMSGPCRRR